MTYSYCTESDIKKDSRKNSDSLKLLFSIEFIPTPGHAVNELHLSRQVYLFTQIKYVCFDRIGKEIDLRIPDVLHDIATRDDVACIFEEIFKQGEFFACEIDGSLASSNFLLRRIECEVAEL